MDIHTIRELIRQGHSVVIVEEGQPPLMVRELEESTRTVRTIHEEAPNTMVVTPTSPPDQNAQKQDQVLERLNKEILALKAQIAEDEAAMR